MVFSLTNCQNKKWKKNTVGWEPFLHRRNNTRWKCMKELLLPMILLTALMPSREHRIQDGEKPEGGTMNVNTERMDAPHELEFTWYSLVENKFYTGKWNLDKEKD